MILKANGVFQTILSTPIGFVQVRFDDYILTKIDLFAGASTPSTAPTLLKPILHRLQSYFETPQTLLDLPYELMGTSSFVKKVLEEMIKIPLGQTLSYGELALKLKTSPRAVGNACRRNPLPLVIPCHRVVGKSGIGGFSGDVHGKPILAKQWLLSHEQKTC